MSLHCCKLRVQYNDSKIYLEFFQTANKAFHIAAIDQNYENLRMWHVYKCRIICEIYQLANIELQTGLSDQKIV